MIISLNLIIVWTVEKACPQNKILPTFQLHLLLPWQCTWDISFKCQIKLMNTYRFLFLVRLNNPQRFLLYVDRNRQKQNTRSPMSEYSRAFSCFKQTELSWKGSPNSHQTSRCVADNTFKDPFAATRSHVHTLTRIDSHRGMVKLKISANY